MTALLISVKNTAEALLALEAGADIIDLKDPNVGALGALDLCATQQIVQAIAGRTHLSATIGENHASTNALISEIEARAQLGVTFIKVAVSQLFYEANFLREMAKLSEVGVKIVAVFFADEKPDLSLLEALQTAGFYGAMLDTKNKANNLFNLQTKLALHRFVELCEIRQLKSGLAGSLKPQHVDDLLKINSTYIGFRGGVCDNWERKSTLSGHKVEEIKNMLRQHNKNSTKTQQILSLALHS